MELTNQEIEQENKQESGTQRKGKNTTTPFKRSSSTTTTTSTSTLQPIGPSVKAKSPTTVIPLKKSSGVPQQSKAIPPLVHRRTASFGGSTTLPKSQNQPTASASTSSIRTSTNKKPGSNYKKGSNNSGNQTQYKKNSTSSSSSVSSVSSSPSSSTSTLYSLSSQDFNSLGQQQSLPLDVYVRKSNENDSRGGSGRSRNSPTMNVTNSRSS